MSLCDFSFLECSYNPDDIKFETVCDQLNRFGFVMINENVSNNVTIWMQSLSIIMLREDSSVDTFAVTGLGFIASEEVVDELGADYDDDLGLYVCTDDCSLRSLFVLESEMFGQFSALDTKYVATMSNSTVKPLGINHFSGIVYDCSDPSVLEHYYKLGFSLQKESDDYYTLLSKNKRMTVMCNRNNSDRKIKTVICDTDDIFYVSAYCAVNNVETKNYDLSYITEDMFGDYTYKVVGYNCLAYGNQNSYSIEKLAKNIAPELDLLFRMRRQHANINERVFLKHFEDEV